MKIVLLAGQGDSTWILANELIRSCALTTIVLEEPVDWRRFWRTRIKNYGWLNVAGQVLFIGYLKLLRWCSTARLRQIMEEHALSAAPLLNVEITRVQSANSERTIELLKQMAPTVVVVNGTRILSARLLKEVKAVFLNMHAGITPKYRGVHGGYWALACRDAGNAGVTVHLVDAGIDTGAVLYQSRISPGPADNFATYPMLQLAVGIPLLTRAIQDAQNACLHRIHSQHTSQIFSHPTLWQYLWLWISTGIR